MTLPTRSGGSEVGETRVCTGVSACVCVRVERGRPIYVELFPMGMCFLGWGPCHTGS